MTTTRSRIKQWTAWFRVKGTRVWRQGPTAPDRLAAEEAGRRFAAERQMGAVEVVSLPAGRIPSRGRVVREGEQA